MDAWQEGALSRLESLIREVNDLSAQYDKIQERLRSLGSRLSHAKGFISGEIADNPEDIELKEAFERLLRFERGLENPPSKTDSSPSTVSNNGHTAPVATEPFTLVSEESEDKGESKEHIDKTGIFFDILQTYGHHGLTFDDIMAHLPKYGNNTGITRNYLFNIRSKQIDRKAIFRKADKIFLTEKGKNYKVSESVKKMKEANASSGVNK